MKIKSNLLSCHEHRRIYSLLKTLFNFSIIESTNYNYVKMPDDNELWYQITIEMEIKDESGK
jgi:hypothetical protein